MQRRSRAVLGVLFATSLLLAAACAKSSDRHHRPAAPSGGGSAPAPVASPSASSWSARRTTTATTRPSTRAAQAVGKANPDLKILTRRERARDGRGRADHGGHDHQGRQDHLRHQLRPPGRGRGGGRAPPRRRRRPPGRLDHRPAAQLRHLLRHRVRAGVPGRHRRRRGDQDEQARLRRRLPDPPDAGQRQRLRARRQGGRTPTSRTTVVFTSSWCDPAKQAEAAKSLLDQGVDVHHPAPGLHQDHRRDDRGRRRHVGRLPPRRLVAGAQGLDHRFGVELGPAVHRHRHDVARPASSPAASTTPTTGSGLRTGDNPFVQSTYGSMVDADTKAKIEAPEARRSRTAARRSPGRSWPRTAP